MKESLRQHPLLLPIYIPTLMMSLARGFLIPILPLYAQSFESAYMLVGLVLASENLGMLLGDVPGGIIESRLGRKRSMLTGIILIAASGMGMALAQSLWQLLLFGLLTGVGDAIWNIARHAYISETAAVDRRGRAIAIFGGLSRTGRFIGPALGGALGAAFTLRAPFIAFSLIAASTAIFPFLFSLGSAEPAVSRGGVRGHARHFGSLLSANAGILASAGTGQLLGQMIRAGRDIILPLYAHDVLGLDVQTIGLVVSAGLLFDVLMFYPAGIIMDRWGRKWAYVPSFLLQGLGLLLIPLALDANTLAIVASITGFANGLGSGTMMTLGADLAPRHSLGEFLAIWRLIGDVGSSGGPIVIGAVAGALTLVPAIFVIGGVGIASAAILGVFVPETLVGRKAPV